MKWQNRTIFERPRNSETTEVETVGKVDGRGSMGEEGEIEKKRGRSRSREKQDRSRSRKKSTAWLLGFVPKILSF